MIKFDDLDLILLSDKECDVRMGQIGKASLIKEPLV